MVGDGPCCPEREREREKYYTYPVLTMINRAVARFWDLLTEFCVLGAAPLSWQSNVAAAHPFIVWNNSWTVVRSLPCCSLPWLCLRFLLTPFPLTPPCP